MTGFQILMLQGGGLVPMHLDREKLDQTTEEEMFRAVVGGLFGHRFDRVN